METPSGSLERRTLGRTGLEVGRLGISSSYGVPGDALERAFERGVNYIYWGSRRTASFGEGLKRLRPQRDKFVLVIQSYARIAGLVTWSLERALRTLRYDHADVLLLGMWNKPVAPRILDAARELKRRGLVRFLAVSTHQRTLVPKDCRRRTISTSCISATTPRIRARKRRSSRSCPPPTAPAWFRLLPQVGGNSSASRGCKDSSWVRIRFPRASALLPPRIATATS